jgi:hypothetical protein
VSRYIYVGPLSDEVFHCLKTTWKTGGLSLQCDYARNHAMEVALCASQGWLSVVDPDGRTYRDRWRITAMGLSLLQYKEQMK